MQDLQNIQWQVVNYWQQKEKLPATLAELNDPIANNIIPLDPQTKEAYEYASTGARSFKLCATFAIEGGTNVLQGRTMAVPTEPVPVNGKEVQDNWQHAAGKVCFDRTIDPQRYPPFSKQKLQ